MLKFLFLSLPAVRLAIKVHQYLIICITKTSLQHNRSKAGGKAHPWECYRDSATEDGISSVFKQHVLLIVCSVFLTAGSYTKSYSGLLETVGLDKRQFISGGRKTLSKITVTKIPYTHPNNSCSCGIVWSNPYHLMK